MSSACCRIEQGAIIQIGTVVAPNGEALYLLGGLVKSAFNADMWEVRPKLRYLKSVQWVTFLEVLP